MHAQCARLWKRESGKTKSHAACMAFLFAKEVRAGDADRSSPNRSSPNLAAVRRRTHHGRIFFTAKGLLELRQVGERANHAVLCNRMRIALDHGPLGFRADLVAA